MPVYRCTNCRRFASLSPGRCFRCGRELTSDAAPGNGGLANGPPSGGPPPPGHGTIYRCQCCNRFATLSPGLCVICGHQLTAVIGLAPTPLVQVSQLLDGANRAQNNVQALLERLAARLREQRWAEIREIVRLLNEERRTILRLLQRIDQILRNPVNTSEWIVPRGQLQRARPAIAEILSLLNENITLVERRLARVNPNPNPNANQGGLFSSVWRWMGY